MGARRSPRPRPPAGGRRVAPATPGARARRGECLRNARGPSAFREVDGCGGPPRRKPGPALRGRGGAPGPGLLVRQRCLPHTPPLRDDERRRRRPRLRRRRLARRLRDPGRSVPARRARPTGPATACSATWATGGSRTSRRRPAWPPRRRIRPRRRRRRLRQRRPPRPLRHPMAVVRALSQPRRRQVRGRHRPRGPGGQPRLADVGGLGRPRRRRRPRPLRLPLPGVGRRPPRALHPAAGPHRDVLRPARVPVAARPRLPQRRRAVRRRDRPRRVSSTATAEAWASSRPTSTATARSTCSSPTTRRRTSSSATWAGFRFAEDGLGSGLAANAGGGYLAGMGVACGDLDGDGRLDLAVTNFFGESTTLYHNLGGGLFADRTAAAGLAVPTRFVLGFGIAALDANNDGRLDLVQANGHVNDSGRPARSRCRRSSSWATRPAGSRTNPPAAARPGARRAWAAGSPWRPGQRRAARCPDRLERPAARPVPQRARSGRPLPYARARGDDLEPRRGRGAGRSRDGRQDAGGDPVRRGQLPLRGRPAAPFRARVGDPGRSRRGHMAVRPARSVRGAGRRRRLSAPRGRPGTPSARGVLDEPLTAQPAARARRRRCSNAPAIDAPASASPKLVGSGTVCRVRSSIAKYSGVLMPKSPTSDEA